MFRRLLNYDDGVPRACLYKCDEHASEWQRIEMESEVYRCGDRLIIGDTPVVSLNDVKIFENINPKQVVLHDPNGAQWKIISDRNTVRNICGYLRPVASVDKVVATWDGHITGTVKYGSTTNMFVDSNEYAINGVSCVSRCAGYDIHSVKLMDRDSLHIANAEMARAYGRVRLLNPKDVTVDEVSPQKCALVAENSRISVIDDRKGMVQEREYSDRTGLVPMCITSCGEAYFAVGSEDGTTRIYNRKNIQRAMFVDHGNGGVTMIRFDRNDTIVITHPTYIGLLIMVKKQQPWTVHLPKSSRGHFVGATFAGRCMEYVVSWTTTHVYVWMTFDIKDEKRREFGYDTPYMEPVASYPISNVIEIITSPIEALIDSRGLNHDMRVITGDNQDNLMDICI
jgi:hypothetical protein